MNRVIGQCPICKDTLHVTRLYCPNCDTLLHEEQFVVDDYAKDPVSKAYQRFFENLEFRTCKQCGEVMLKPEVL